MIKDYNDLKIIAFKKNIRLETEMPLILGYKSRWGLKLALKNPNRKEKILKKANEVFKDI